MRAATQHTAYVCPGHDNDPDYNCDRLGLMGNWNSRVDVFGRKVKR